MKVVISSGHSLKVRGASAYLDEVNEARDVVERVAMYLRNAGVGTITYHDDVSTTQDENLRRIVDFHNAQKRDLDVSCHFNAYETTDKPMGVECWYREENMRGLADQVSRAIAEAGQLLNRGPKQSGNLYFLNKLDDSILIEVCFVDSSTDAALYKKHFESICSAIAVVISNLDGEYALDALPVLQLGDSGEDVKRLQSILGLPADGYFGPTTEMQVRAFQAACYIDVDGVCGPATWRECGGLNARMRHGERLPEGLVEVIRGLAVESELADYNWPDRGVAPPGYVPGMALSFAVAVKQYQAGEAHALLMGRGNTEDDDTDAIALYKEAFDEIEMEVDNDGLDTLRALFVLMIGLGMRESSGTYCEGRDQSADNVSSDTCEAGLFQTSWNINAGSSMIPPLLQAYWENPNGFRDEFAEGITSSTNDLESYGSDDGARYQFLAKFCPLFAVMVTGVGLRVLCKHWGPVQRFDVDLRPEADVLLQEVQKLVMATV